MPDAALPSRKGPRTPGGTLFKLPREIRDEIYRLLVKGRYIILQEPFCCDIAESGQPSPDTHLAILRSSKPISHEAKSIMYSESRFIYEMKIDSFYVYMYNRMWHKILHPILAAVDLMRNLEIVVRGKPGSEMVVEGFVQHSIRLRDTIMDIIIGGARTERDTLRIKIMNSSPSLLSPSLLHKFSLMTGFRTVIIFLVEPASTVSETFLKKFQNSTPALQSRLGPAESGSTPMVVGNPPNVRGCYLKYHPRKYHAETLGRAVRADDTVGDGVLRDSKLLETSK